MFGLFKKNNLYLVTIEFAKFKRNRSIRKRYELHQGGKINNSFFQSLVELNAPNEFLKDMKEEIIKKYPEANNFIITDIKRID